MPQKILTQSDIERRFPLWDSLSDLFLDTELDTFSHQSIASAIIKSEYTPEEIHDIFWYEVFPGVGDNLRTVAGEWAGFNQEWLKDRILTVISGEGRYFVNDAFISVHSLVQMTRKEWAKVCEHLPDDFRDYLITNSKTFRFTRNPLPKPWWRFWR